jgi:glycosyltransferase involved in cell wall biosynthesis
VNPLYNSESNRNWLAKSCAIADLVVVSTPILAKRYGAHERVMVVPNCVPAWYCDLQAKDHPLTVGWSGSVITHPGDLEETGGEIQGALDASGARFTVVGTGNGVRENLALRDEPDATGWRDLDKYPQAIQHLDVGIVPLRLTPFNEAKSYLKGLEMAAVGVPFVASPTAEYRKLAAEGVGWIAESPAEWRFLVEQLARDRVQREALGEAWREVVRERYTVEGNAWRWLEAWTYARELADQRAAA